MNPFAQRPFVTVGKTNFTTVVMAEKIRQSVLEWRDSLPETWQAAGEAFPEPVLLWMAERGLIAIRLDVQWYPPQRPPYVVRVAVEHSGPFVYRRFLEEFAKLQCVLPEWRESLSGSEWEVPTISQVKRRGTVGEYDTMAVEALAQYDGQNGVTTGKGRSLTEAMAAVQREFTTRINRVEFDGVVVFRKRMHDEADNGQPEKPVTLLDQSEDGVLFYSDLITALGIDPGTFRTHASKASLQHLLPTRGQKGLQLKRSDAAQLLNAVAAYASSPDTRAKASNLAKDPSKIGR